MFRPARSRSRQFPSAGTARCPALRCRARSMAPPLPALCDICSAGAARSEEHTSELQSPCNLVCRLLLEKKTLDQRLAEERQERPGTEEVLSVIEEGFSDDEDELVGEAALERDECASPEEAAVPQRDRAPGATDHADPHPD